MSKVKGKKMRNINKEEQARDNWNSKQRSIVKMIAIFPNTAKTKTVFHTPLYCQLTFMLEGKLR